MPPSSISDTPTEAPVVAIACWTAAARALGSGGATTIGAIGDVRAGLATVVEGAVGVEALSERPFASTSTAANASTPMIAIAGKTSLAEIR
jgi:hypothetical protein